MGLVTKASSAASITIIFGRAVRRTARARASSRRKALRAVCEYRRVIGVTFRPDNYACIIFRRARVHFIIFRFRCSWGKESPKYNIGLCTTLRGSDESMRQQRMKPPSRAYSLKITGSRLALSAVYASVFGLVSIFSQIQNARQRPSSRTQSHICTLYI